MGREVQIHSLDEYLRLAQNFQGITNSSSEVVFFLAMTAALLSSNLLPALCP